MSDQQLVRIKLNSGSSKLTSWFERKGDKMIGMGRRQDYDRNGRVTKDVTYPTGITVSYSK